MIRKLLSIVGLSAIVSIYADAQIYPSDFTQVEVASGITNATAMAFAPDGRIFVAQQNGVLHVIKNGVKLATPAISLSVDSNGERGLIGIALHPAFSSNGIIYLHYTLPDGSRNRISRFWLNGDVLNPASEQVIYNLDALGSDTNHNGGAMVFHNNRLYVGVGDNATRWKARDVYSTHGKLLRMNADGSTPGDNVVYPGPVWGYGLRNPYTLDIDPATGKIFVNDVGENNWEEINDATTKANFGWPDTEGPTTNSSFRSPVYAYEHGSGDGKGCAISGGVFFSPATTSYPTQYLGKYFYQDLCNGWINYLDLSGGTAVRHPFATGLPGSSLGLELGSDGNLYFLSRATGKLYKIVYNTTQPPMITDQPDGAQINQYSNIVLSVEATGAQPFTYQWKKNGSNIDGANSRTLSFTNIQPADAGNYTVVVANAYGSATSSIATLIVQENRPPEVSIGYRDDPDFFRYRAQELKWYSGQAVDPEEGNIQERPWSNWYESGFLWRMDYFKGGVYQRSTDISNQSNLYFIIPETSDPSPDAFYRIVFTATDTHGLSGKDSIDIYPYISQVTLQTSPPGLDLMLDGERVTTPHSVGSVEGVQRTLTAPSVQSANGDNYAFSEWGDETTETTVTFATPRNDTTVVGYYNETHGEWTSTDIGPVATPGYVDIDDGTFTIHASGKDIWESSDEFHYVSQPVSGDVDIRVRVAGMSNTVHSWAKTGVMIRETLQANSKHAMNVITPSQGIAFQRRTQTGGTTYSSGTSGATPYWLRLTRVGNTFTAYKSSDGTNWSQTATHTFAMSSSAYVGMVLSSHSSTSVSTSTMTDVSISSPVSGASLTETTTMADAGLILYPTPARGNSMQVRVPNGIRPPARLRIINALGQTVMEEEINSSDALTSFSVDLSKVSKGYYVLRLVSQEQSMKAAFVRE